MDASDTTRRKKAVAYFSKQKIVFAAKPENNGLTSNCGTCSEASATAPCIKVFTNYDDKILYVVGKNYCATCACTQ